MAKTCWLTTGLQRRQGLRITNMFPGDLICTFLEPNNMVSLTQ